MAVETLDGEEECLRAVCDKEKLNCLDGIRSRA